ncbi:MAG: hypothetical protein ABL974_03265 [Prosthecobacter sp.]
MRPLLCLLTFCVISAHAQFDVTMKLPRPNFMALEAIDATVTITNRTGAEAVLGGPGRAEWLSFEMTTSEGQQLTTMDVSGADLVQIPPGGTIARKVTVTDAYAPSEVGNYAITARVFHAPSGDYYASNRTRFSIVDAKPLWEQSYGVPAGFKDAGKPRKYSLSVFRDVDSTSLYFRLIDDKSSDRLRTFRLGPLSMVHDPQIAIDATNQLQVLFMAQPQLFAHAIVAPDGVLKKMAYYRQKGSDRPMMVQSMKGTFEIAGGEYFDPSAPAAAKPKVGGKGVSEKPPGL